MTDKKEDNKTKQKTCSSKKKCEKNKTVGQGKSNQVKISYYI